MIWEGILTSDQLVFASVKPYFLAMFQGLCPADVRVAVLELVMVVMPVRLGQIVN